GRAAGRRRRRSGPGPGGETEAMAGPAHRREYLELPARTELVDLQADRVFQALQVVFGFLASEQRMREIAAAGEQLQRHLVFEHELEGREPEARLAFGERIELLHAARREHAEQAIAERVDDEGVTEGVAGAAEELGGIAQQADAGAEPRQPSGGARRHRVDGRQQLAHRAPSYNRYRSGRTTMANVTLEKVPPHTTIIRLNRPERLNAMSIDLCLELKSAFEQ